MGVGIVYMVVWMFVFELHFVVILLKMVGV